MSFDPDVAPSGTGCADCEAAGGWWVHLRRCARCGHVGCCDSSPAQHATAHFRESGHPVVQSFEPGEGWFWDYEKGKGVLGPPLAPPTSRPADQTVPGPAERVPADWRDHIHSWSPPVVGRGWPVLRVRASQGAGAKPYRGRLASDGNAARCVPGVRDTRRTPGDDH
jgi:hypothetical protein